MCALELRSAHLYWHVSEGEPRDWFLCYSPDASGSQELWDEDDSVTGGLEELVERIKQSVGEMLDSSLTSESERYALS